MVHVLLPDGTDIDVVVILLKPAAGGFAGLHDATALLALGDAPLVEEVERHVAGVRPDVRDVWGQMRSAYESRG